MAAAVRLKQALGNTTTAYNGETSGKRARVAFVAGSAQHLSGEIGCLLRRRLRIAVLIALTGFSLLLIRTLIETPEPLVGVSSYPFLHGGIVLLLAAASVLLWSRQTLSVFALRALELVLFGSMAAFIGYLQYTMLHRGAVLNWAKEEHYDDILTMAGIANSLRWVLLIVLYGTFIPNTWRRCALVVGCMALTPLVLNFVICADCPIMGPHLSVALFDSVLILSVASAIAIFGSYKISELHQEAFEAKKLGQYQLQKLLGAGGMGEVHLGEHLLLRRQCAIKLIRPEHAGDPTTLERFEREVQAMATLTHWNTVEIYDYGRTEDGTFYYVMEYLPGLSLEEMVEQHGPLPPARAVHFLRQLCAALREAHAIGLIHRDIKPSNVIACQRGGVHDVAKLLDFGLVQCFGLDESNGKLTVQGTVLGSPAYISPEQALGKGNVDRRTDIYSLGGLAYFLLTGQTPFVRETAMEMLVAHVHELAAPPSELRTDIPADVDEIVLRCLRKDPQKRFDDVAALDDALASCACAGDWDGRQAGSWWESQPRAVTAVTAV
jgi:eukaryotic-like serine/threonine-protein kinase